MNKISTVVIVLLFFSSCSKSGNTDQYSDREKPAIMIYYPAAKENYQPGQQLCFKAQVEDNNSVYRVAVSINDKSNKAIKQYEYFPGSKIFVIDQKYIIPESMTESFSLDFEANDNCGNSVKTTLPLSVRF